MLKKEVQVFILVGLITVLVDFISYHLVLYFIQLYSISKCVGFIMGSIFAYLANKTWTFKHRSAANYSVSKFALLYLGTLVLNVSINSLTIKLLGQGFIAIQLAFLMATTISALTNFVGMRQFVFTQGKYK